MNNDKKTPAELMERGVVCCEAAIEEQGALSFNPFNAVVQCHACGRVYTPTPLAPTPPYAPKETHLAHDIVAALRFHEHPITKQAADEIERLRKALAEVVVRTMPYQDDHEGWPLVAGVHRVAHDALAESQ